MTNPPGTAGLAHTLHVPQDQPDKPVPATIAEVIFLARILACWGRHLAALIPYRGLWRAYPTVARFLGNASVSDTLARIHRGILRAMALERVLLQRAVRGRDLKPLAKPNRYTVQAMPWPDDAQTGPHPAEGPDTQQRPKATPVWSRGGLGRYDDRSPTWVDHVPSLKELEDEARRLPIGRTIAAICLDLGVSHKLCAPWFWNGLFWAMQNYRGNVARMLSELHLREVRWEKEDWKHPGMPWPERTTEGVQNVLGFLIGDGPVEPRHLIPPYTPPAASMDADTEDPDQNPPPSLAPPAPGTATGTGPP